MYVGITRAKNKLYLTTAKRRQMWGEYKYYTPSRFIDEIPAELIDEECSEDNEYSSVRSTFRNAVKSVKSSKFDNEPEAKASFSPDGFVKPTSSFGKNFVAPQNRTTNVVKRTPSRIIVKKNPINKEKEDEKLKKFFEDNVMKRKIEEHKREEAEREEWRKKEAELKETAAQYFFNEGERVFHEKFGVGHIVDATPVGDSTMYVIDFGKFGKKAMDAAYAHLKKF